MLNGLSLFSGIGGLDVALSGYVRPIAYCEVDPYCQAVLFSRMAQGLLCKAPLWDDVRTLSCEDLFSTFDIIYAGFPCQDISVAGLRKGLEGERSGLFFQIVRLAKEIKPKFIFLENTKGIISKGGVQVIESLTSIGFNCRWITKNCREVGSPQNRERWFCLAYSEHPRSFESSTMESFKETIRDNQEGKKEPKQFERSNTQGMLSSDPAIRSQHYWNSKPPVCRMVDGSSFRMERIRSIANSVCPQQAKEAFKELLGLK